MWKLNASGGTVWAGSMGGSGVRPTPWGIAADGSGNAYVTGDWDGGTNNFNPGSGKAVSLPYHGGGDIFIVKLTPGKNGAMQLGWAKDIGGSGIDCGNAVAVDGSGNVYTTGGFTGTVNFNPNTGTAHNLSGGGIFVSKLDANGNYVAAASMAGTADGTGEGTGRGITLDGSGNVYTTGLFQRHGRLRSDRRHLQPHLQRRQRRVRLGLDADPHAGSDGSPAGRLPTMQSPTLITAANGSFSPTGPAVALPATADPVAPDQIDWFAAAAARKRSTAVRRLAGSGGHA